MNASAVPAGDAAADAPIATIYASRLASAAFDELLTPDATPHDHAADLAATIEHLGLPGLLTRRAEIAHLVEDEGVTYGSSRTQRRWRLDPLPVILDPTSWSHLEAGLTQRARLLDLMMADLYGPRNLLRHKVIPPEVILAHPGFIRAADGVTVPGAHQLILTATDLARAEDGRWCVISDRTAAPSGAGYAIQARRIVGRVLPGLYRDTRLHRLRSFFDTLRLALRDVAPRTAEAPRVVILIPGPSEQTPFDHAFLATLLGYPLVTAEDLTVRGGRVYLRSLGRLEPVDVVLRRLGDLDADPLELRADSDLGVPGLMEAVRRGTVSVVNPIGASVLETPALAPYLDAATRALLDEEPLLSSVPTWWCADDASRRRVLDRLDELVLLPVVRSPGAPMAIVGAALSQAGRDELRRRIEARPHAWCAQESLPLTTTPIVTSAGLAPRRFTLRTFAVGHGGGYRLLTGGLGRIAPEVGNHAAGNSDQAPAKDVWVLATAEPAVPASVDLAWPRALAIPAPAAEVLPPRVAENLFRLGRFAERAEDAVRLLRVVDDLTEDWTARPGTPGAAALEVMRGALMHDGSPETRSEPGSEPRSEPSVRALVGDAESPGSVAASIRATVAAAQALREQLSLDTWIVLGSLERVLAETAASPEGDAPLQPVLARVLEGLLALAGLAAESMVRDLGWAFMDAGRRIERARQLITLLRRTLDVEYSPAVQTLVVESVLVAGESIITYRRREPGRSGTAQIAAVLDLLLLDRGNPRSVALQLDRLLDDLARLPDATPLQARARAVQARLRELDPQVAAQAVDGRRGGLSAVLDAALTELDRLALDLTDTHFGHVAPHHTTAAIRGWDA